MMRNLLLLLFAVSFTFAIIGCKQGEEQKGAENDKAPAEQTTPSEKNPNTTTEEEKGASGGETAIDESKTVAAIVNGVPIYREDLKNTDLQKAIEKELLYQYGVDHGYYDENVKKRVEDFKKSLVVSKVKIDAINDYMALNPVTPDELENAYEKNKADYIYLQLSELEIGDKETAEKVYQEAKKGVDFENIAKKYGESKVKYTKHNRATKRYNRFFSELKPGAISELVEGNNKYYVFKIEDTQQLPMPDVRRRLKLEKEAQKKRMAIKNLVDNIKKSGEYKIEIVK